MSASSPPASPSETAPARSDDALRALRESEERHRMVLQSTPLVQWAIDRKGIFTLSEGRGLAALGLRPGEVVGRSVRDVYAAIPEIVGDYERALGGASFRKVNVIGGAIFESAWAPLLDDAGAVVGVTGIAVDITERVRAEEAQKRSDARLAVAERLAATGRLAAGVAHEVNNPLAYVLANLDAALTRLREMGPEREVREVIEALEDARGGAERVREIVRDLRMFSRSDEGSASADPVAVARSALAMARNELRHRASRVETEFGAVPLVAMREARLAQALVNLLLNAAQAIPEGRAADNQVRLAVRARGDRVEIEVADSGAGMPPEVQARIFDPFFSTKAVGEGMGLGLSIVHAIVTDAGGAIEFESAPGRGSTFRLLLPALHAAAELPPPPRPAPAPPAAAAAAPRRLRILVVDDEPLVARATARLLPGHAVTIIDSGHEVLRRVGDGERFDVIFCDLMMPDVTGADVYRGLLADAPEQAARVVFVTGGAFTDGARAFVEQAGRPVLEKPLLAEQLEATVRAVGDPPRTGE